MNYALPLNVNNREPTLETSNILGWILDWPTEINPYLQKCVIDNNNYYDYGYPCKYFEKCPDNWRFMAKSNGRNHILVYLTYYDTSLQGIRNITDAVIEVGKQFANKLFGITREIKLFPAIEWVPNESDDSEDFDSEDY
jgi:hypothetical protein